MMDLRLILDACCNHLGSLPLIEEMIERAQQLGSYSIKFQLFNHFKLALDYPNYKQVKQNMIRDQINLDTLHFIFKKCDECGIIPMFTIFSEDRISILDDFSKYNFIVKVASPDFTNKFLVNQILSSFKDRLIIISTGMTSKEQIPILVSEYRQKHTDIKFLYCISKYPTFATDISIKDMSRFDGFSDHTSDTRCTKYVIDQLFETDRLFFLEKHFTLSKNLPGKDQKISMDTHNVMDIMNHYNTLKNNEYYKRRFI